ncbi:hypothetical protein ID852_12610 [Xenorhabdus sp. 42]|uniref:Integrase n=1 Tax=Xenorhabdus szentirmaii TaxID=290112 RepID=A0AAW3YS64_9GAMM|nr:MULTISPECIES: hypothetical protein [unclassified Xenorhabdus]MBD2780397.1 hypothetical protein [Xenorhabdus sp. 38]MBD2792484.1 hypothetical protein [Xenorhabdus sp. CUL]MBD2799754.1 hypothetical protein [Xenorhabdus sp. M]MBD2821520.1 hypothetical protein [Xenorhabdus sp. 42]MBD2824953.1 hypothetical protein [Xenorhabdus sp. 5]
MLAGCYLPEPIPHYIETQMGHVSSQMVYNMYGTWMMENSNDQVKLLNEKPATAPYVPQLIGSTM